MKATGIVRRIDELGRIVLPKEIRRTMKIREGDPLEIFTDRDGEVIFKKYSPVGEMAAFSAQYADTLHRTGELSVIICDRDYIISCGGVSKKEYLEKQLSEQMESLMDTRNMYVYKGDDEKIYPLGDGGSFFVSCAMPIIADGDIIGCVASLCEDSRAHTPDVTEQKLIQTASAFLGKQHE